MNTQHVDNTDWAGMIMKRLISFSEKIAPARSKYVTATKGNPCIRATSTKAQDWKGQWRVLKYL